MPVVVTGAAGFIGGMLISALAADGERVVAVDRRPIPVCPAGVAVLNADLLDRNPDVDDALRTAEVVYHLAGSPGVRPPGPQAEYHRYRDNVLATRVVLAMVPLSTPLVVTSSAAVYGGYTDHASREEDQVRPPDAHARSKVEVERLCAERFAVGGAVAVARPFTVAGEGQRPDMAIARWIEAVRTGSPVHLFGSPWHSRDVIDVRDVVRSLRAIAERGVVGLLNIGSGAPRTLADLVTAVCQAIGAPPELEILPARPGEPAVTQADTSRHEQVLGFRPRTDLDTLVRRQIAAGLVNERLTLAREASARAGVDGPDRAAVVHPVLVEPVFMETVLVGSEEDRAALAEVVLGPADPDPDSYPDPGLGLETTTHAVERDLDGDVDVEADLDANLEDLDAGPGPEMAVGPDAGLDSFGPGAGTDPGTDPGPGPGADLGTSPDIELGTGLGTEPRHGGGPSAIPAVIAPTEPTGTGYALR